MKKLKKPKAAPKPHNKHEDGPPQRSQRLKETEGTVKKKVDVTTQADQMEVDEQAEVSVGNSEKGDASTQNARASSESCKISLTETLPINLAVLNLSVSTSANDTLQDDTNIEGPSSESLPDCSKAPDWIKDAADELGKMGLGDDYSETLKTFVRLETLWKDLKHIQAGPQVKLRPIMLSRWVSLGHFRAKTPEIIANEFHKFKGVWIRWWGVMQPEWRTTSGHVTEWGKVADGSDWSALQLLGPNRFLGILATLAWWGVAARCEGDDEVKAWMAAVGDVAGVLKGLVESEKLK